MSKSIFPRAELSGSISRRMENPKATTPVSSSPIPLLRLASIYSRRKWSSGSDLNAVISLHQQLAKNDSHTLNPLANPGRSRVPEPRQPSYTYIEHTHPPSSHISPSASIVLCYIVQYNQLGEKACLALDSHELASVTTQIKAPACSYSCRGDMSQIQWLLSPMGIPSTFYLFLLTTGNYSRLACEIQFVRSMGYYLIQIYIPSGLIVIISWVSFWLNRNATPARVALGVTTVLTMTTLMSSTNAALPKISYVKSIDVYLGTCFVMVFASLLEYATVGYMAKRIQMRKNRFQKIAESMKAARENPGPPGVPGDHGDHAPKQTEVRFKVHDPKAHSKGGTLENTINGRADEEAPPAPPHLIHPTKDISKLYGTPCITPSDIDKYSRIVFPVCFVCFNLMYWIIYLHISDVVADDLVLLEEAK
ncbi:hypothetical protein G9C98_006451 [Cotesia typhae]|uniref:Neurotransmitter-gated ion-channel transmembrane domain-containing protein n=1 Tax=Cotesia typhae TaxID=2053667 RepID=A0A8J5QT57_9HYME|nr:hypothetical protein G9C98_006451 [Cotesia typhae]